MGELFVIGGLTLCTDVSAADWVVERVRDFGHDVGSLVPPGFAGYARVFHPAYRDDGEGEREVRWGQVAAANGRRGHPSMQWSSITGSRRFLREDTQPGLWDHEPSEGSLPIRQAAQLAALLSGHTARRGRCSFGVWDGFGALAVPREDVPRVGMPQRPMLLLSGPLSAVTTSLEHAPCDQRANLWWPEDRAWCVATDVDLMSTYVAGSRACIAAVVASTELEAMAISVDERVDWGSDTLNPLPPGGGE